jgi:hypothetical protein
MMISKSRGALRIVNTGNNAAPVAKAKLGAPVAS